MSLDYSRLRTISAREIMSALLRDGFILEHSHGSHNLFRHPDGRRVTLSFHGRGENFRPKTLRSIIETQARWNENDLQRLGLL